MVKPLNFKASKIWTKGLKPLASFQRLSYEKIYRLERIKWIQWWDLLDSLGTQWIHLALDEEWGQRPWKWAWALIFFFGPPAKKRKKKRKKKRHLKAYSASKINLKGLVKILYGDDRLLHRSAMKIFRKILGPSWARWAWKNFGQDAIEFVGALTRKKQGWNECRKKRRKIQLACIRLG